MQSSEDIKARANAALKDAKEGRPANPALVIAAMIAEHENSAVDWSLVEKNEAYCNEIVSSEPINRKQPWRP